MPSFSNVKCGLITVAAVTMGLFALGMVYSFKKANVTINSPDSMILYSDQSLPTSFIFGVEYDTPRQTNSDEWIGATIDFIESTYRSFGIRSGFLGKDTYLKFNSSFYTAVIQHFNKEIVILNQNNNNFVAATFPKLFETIPEFVHYFVTDCFCSLNNCSEIAKVPQANSILMEPIDYHWAVTVSDIKQLLSESEQPLLLSIPSPTTKYVIPCEDDRVECTAENSYVCPDYLNIQGNQLCTSLFFPSEFSSAEFYKPVFPAVADYGPPLTFILYGWNDDFVTKIPNFQISTIHLSSGGFLVKRSIESSKGNAIGFYDGTLLFSENDEICGNPNDPRRWKDGDILKCIDESFCDKRFNYSIYAQKNNGEHVVNEDVYGLTTTKMYRWNQTQKILFDFDRVPYQNLELAFNLLSSSDNSNGNNYLYNNRNKDNNDSTDKDLCSYWFLPYDVVEQADSKESWNLKKVHAVNFAAKWSKASYQKKNEAIETSMRKISSRKVSYV